MMIEIQKWEDEINDEKSRVFEVSFQVEAGKQADMTLSRQTLILCPNYRV